MSVSALLEQALREGRFSPFADGSTDNPAARATLLARLHALQTGELTPWDALEQAVQSPDALALTAHDANALYFCDQLFEQCQAQTDLEPPLLEHFLHLRPLVAAVLLHESSMETALQHPLFSLLDQLWDAGRYWSPELGRQGDKYRARLDDMLATLRAANPATAPFSSWLAEFSKQLEKDMQRAELLTTRICQAERGSLAGQHADRVVRRHINVLLSALPMPEAVEELIKGPVRHSLQQIFLSQGADSNDWRELIDTAQLLIQSMQTPADEEARQRLYQLIPKLPPLLGRQLVSIGNQNDMDDWLRRVEKLHMQMLLDGKVDLRPAQALSMLDDESGISTNISAALLEQVAQIPEGQWLLYQKENGETMRCRLAMKIEDGGQLLFVNVLGAKCLEKSLEEFAYLLAARHVRLLNADNNFSQILRDTIGHFLQLFQRQALLLADASVRQRAEDERRRQAQEKARLEAERIAAERLAAQHRAEEQARRLAEEHQQRQAAEARLAAEAAERAAIEARQLAEQAARHAEAEAAKRAQAEAARRQAEAEAETQRLLMEEKQARLQEWEEVQQGVRSLGVGAWVDMDINGERQKCKLAAVINASDKLIFVGRDGRKLAEIKRDEMIKRILDGQAAILERGDQFENSLAKVIQTLRKD